MSDVQFYREINPAGVTTTLVLLTLMAVGTLLTTGAVQLLFAGTYTAVLTTILLQLALFQSF